MISSFSSQFKDASDKKVGDTLMERYRKKTVLNY